jgi:hypothetical protein
MDIPNNLVEEFYALNKSLFDRPDELECDELSIGVRCKG